MSIRRFSNENFSDKKHKVASNLVSTETIVQNSFDITQSVNQLNQFGADGSQLLNLPAKVHPGEQLLKQAVWWIDSAHSSADGQEIQNLGWGGNALNAQLGSAPGPDSNDPKFLPWEGENYVYLPGVGVGANCLLVTDQESIHVTGDIDLRIKISGSTQNRSWFYKGNPVLTEQDLFLGPGGNSSTFNLLWNENGTSRSVNFGNRLSDIAAAVVNDTVWVRATLDVDNGAGQYEAKLWLSSNDGISWVQSGSTQTGSTGPTQITYRNHELRIGGTLNRGWDMNANVHRVQILDGIAGSPVLDIDTSLVASGSDTSFTALTGQTVTISRKNIGRKSVAVTHPVWLFGTDDYMEVADNDLLDFGASDSFTVLVIARQWDEDAAFAPYIRKQPTDSGTSGYRLQGSTAGLLRQVPTVSDGTNSVSANQINLTEGDTSVIAMVVDRSAQEIDRYLNAVGGTPVSISSVGSLANSDPLMIGARSTPSNYQQFEFIAAAVFRKALTAGEITTLTTYFQGRAA